MLAEVTCACLNGDGRRAIEGLSRPLLINLTVPKWQLCSVMEDSRHILRQHGLTRDRTLFDLRVPRQRVHLYIDNSPCKRCPDHAR